MPPTAQIVLVIVLKTTFPGNVQGERQELLQLSSSLQATA